MFKVSLYFSQFFIEVVSILRGFFTFLLLAANFSLGFAKTSDTVVIGVLAFRSVEQTQARWQPTVDFLQEKIPEKKFRLEVMDHPEIHAALIEKRVDFLLTNPEDYLLDRKFSVLFPIATLMTVAAGRAQNKLGGVIFKKSGNSGIAGIEDLRGKVLASPNAESMGGYLTQFVELANVGIDLRRGDATLLFTGMPHDRVVGSVLSGQADAGFVRTGVIEDMIEEGRLRATDVEIINAHNDDSFPLMRSTPLYPEWPLLATERVDNEIIKKVTLALLQISAQSKMAVQGQYFGFSPPGDYSAVESLMINSKLFPGRLDAFDSRDVFEKYSREFEVALIFILLLTLALSYRFVSLYRRIADEKSSRADAMSALMMAEKRFQDVFDKVSIGIARISMEAEWIEVNDRFIEILGYSREELLGKALEEFSHPEDLVNENSLVLQLFKGAGRIPTCDQRLRHRQGQFIWVRVSVTKIANVHTENAYFVAVVEDIQELKTTQIALEESSNELLAINRYQTRLLEDERARLSRELHDELGQRLTGLNFFLTQIGHDNNVNQVQSAVAEVASIASLVRHLAHQIRPPQLDHLGLVASIKGHLKYLNLAARFTLDFEENLAEQRLNPFLELTVFRVVQESLTNILRYAKASSIFIELYQSESQLMVSIKDDGVGFELRNEHRKAMGLGILGMRERVAACRGDFLIESRLNEGTVVTARFDLASMSMEA